jgi:hypothetical protein
MMVLSMQNRLKDSQIHNSISGIPFPASNKDVLEYARNKGAPDRVIDLLKGIPEKKYKNEAEIINNLDINR